MRPEQVEKLEATTSAMSTTELLAWAAGQFGPRVAFATSLGAEDQVLTDMLSRAAPSIAVFTIDTGRLPQETYDLLEATRSRYRLRIEVLFPDPADMQPLLTEHGPDCFRRSVEERLLCCQLRKVKPLRRRLAGMEAWITGLRRAQSVTRSELRTLQWDAANRLLKLSPLADWTEQQVWDYLRRHAVPYSALHDRGYPSVGCAPCTRAVAPGQDIRAGRWWWESPEHHECGLHRHQGARASTRTQQE